MSDDFRIAINEIVTQIYGIQMPYNIAENEAQNAINKHNVETQIMNAKNTLFWYPNKLWPAINDTCTIGEKIKGIIIKRKTEINNTLSEYMFRNILIERTVKEQIEKWKIYYEMIEQELKK